MRRRIIKSIMTFQKSRAESAPVGYNLQWPGSKKRASATPLFRLPELAGAATF
jgi:hypothetical protein